MSSHIIPYALGLMVVLAVVSWVHYRLTGGKPETNEDAFAEGADERDLGLLQAHSISHAETGGDDAD